ncbi:MarR family winged helix-turn-helix transcriptional regulator [Paenibacillus sp. MMS20-IR301]|uniref:MarR family winged helix-turn-helix transcriptional regulator n=1 Tax=Paenibacillus sp. MMS20-IR301 TaxID=2895946 RepID=UPI0028E66C3D|nr:MarR family winged helix-turn-helix transcriptional regulator [Paenibacillus sp. MMS20-IR301]WNS46722.1 MarR family winged helix-turn-helix transcriptional regulator [Paenibacillus sp. MMS20-IR301]
MNVDNDKHIDELMEAFQQFARMSWRKTTLWGLKPSEIRVLVSIQKGMKKDGGKGRTVSDLSKQLKVTSPTVTQMVNSLIAQGYAVRTPDSQDRRISDITLTDKGSELAGMAVAKARETFQGMIDHLGKERSEALRELLNEVYGYFDSLNSRENDF